MDMREELDQGPGTELTGPDGKPFDPSKSKVPIQKKKTVPDWVNNPTQDPSGTQVTPPQSGEKPGLSDRSKRRLKRMRRRAKSWVENNCRFLRNN